MNLTMGVEGTSLIVHLQENCLPFFTSLMQKDQTLQKELK